MDMFPFIRTCCMTIICYKMLEEVFFWMTTRYREKYIKNRVYDSNVLLKQHVDKIWKQLRTCVPVLRQMLYYRSNLHVDEPSIEDAKAFLGTMSVVRNLLPTEEDLQTLELLFNNSKQTAEFESWVMGIKEVVREIESCARDAFIDTKPIVDQSLNIDLC